MPAAAVVVSPSAPAVATARAAPSDARDPGAGGDQFGRQLDAARNRQQPDPADTTKAAHAPGTPGSGAKSSATGNAPDASAVAAAASPGSLTDPDADAGDAVDDAPEKQPSAADGASTDAVPPLVLSAFVPFVASALPASAAGRAAPAAGTGAVAVAAGIADAAKLLQTPDGAAPTDGDKHPAATGSPLGLAAVIDAVGARAADDAQGAATPASSIGTALLPPLAAPAAVQQLSVVAPVGTPGFGQELAQQVTWLTSQGVKQARIQLHPENLGPLELKISVSHEHVDVTFSAQHPGTVQALQQSLPQLGQMLAQQGLSLGHAEVSQHGGGSSSAPHRHGPDATATDDAGDLPVAGVTAVTGTLNLLDAFA